MTSYLLDGVLLLALIATGIRVGMIYRELRRLRGYHEHYVKVFKETGVAASAIDAGVRDINAHGAQILLALGERIDQAERLAAEIAEHNAEAQRISAELLEREDLGQRIAAEIGERSDDAYRLVVEIDDRMDAVAQHFEAEQERASNILPFATAAGRQAEARKPRVEEPAKPLPAPPVRPAAEAPRQERKVEWPKLGERFNQWRDSEDDPQGTAGSARRRGQH